MARYLAQRLLQAVFVLWAAYTLSFAILFLLPGDPVSIMLGGSQDAGASAASPEQVARLRAQYGLDKPWWEQYGSLLWRALHLDFGTSVQSGVPVVRLFEEALPHTLLLASFSLLISLVAGVGLALAATWARSGAVRQLLLSLPGAAVSVPGFWLGLLLIQLFSFQLGWVPALGNEGFASLVLPAVTMAVPTAGVFAQVLAKSLRATLREPYIETARAKGLTRRAIHLGHAFRNAAIPCLTLIGMHVGNLFAGSVVVETVFSRIGVGRIAETAVNSQDIPVVQGMVVLAALVFVIVNLAVDLVYPLVDPRITRRREAIA